MVESRRVIAEDDLVEATQDAPGRTNAMEVLANEFTCTRIKIETPAFTSSEGESKVNEISSCAYPDKAEHNRTLEGVKLELQDSISDWSHSATETQAEVPHLNQHHFSLFECDSKVKIEIDEKVFCPVCLIVVSDTDNAVQCDSICDKWFHIHCVGLSEAEYVILGQTDDTWICPFCLDEGLNAPSQTTVKDKSNVSDGIHENETPSSPLSNYLGEDGEEYIPSSSSEFEGDQSDEDFLESKSVRTRKKTCRLFDGGQSDEDFLDSKSVRTRKKTLRLSDVENIYWELDTADSSGKTTQRNRILRDNGNSLARCSECDFSSISDSRVYRHYREVHMRDKPFKCKVCNYRTSASHHMKDHIMRHTGEKPFKCDHCPARFPRKGDLVQHSTVHTGEKPFKCGECAFKSSRRGNLQVHLLQHSGEKPFECDQCHTRFHTNIGLAQHMRKYCRESFKCGECAYKSYHPANLKVHLLKYAGEKPFECDQCHTRFHRKLGLAQHMKVHTGEKPFKCGECDYKSSRRGNLQVHLLQNSGEKPFECDHCHTRFHRKIGLERHMKVHTGEKLFRCGECDYESCHQSNLQVHLAQHSGIKTFKCKRCCHRVTTKATLKAHMRSVHGEI